MVLLEVEQQRNNGHTPITAVQCSSDGKNINIFSLNDVKILFINFSNLTFYKDQQIDKDPV